MLTVGDVSRDLRVSRSTVCKWVRQGLLRAAPLPGNSQRNHWRIDPRDYESFLWRCSELTALPTDPTPAEIMEACREIQRTWSDRVESSRRGDPHQPWEPPRVSD